MLLIIWCRISVFWSSKPELAFYANGRPMSWYKSYLKFVMNGSRLMSDLTIRMYRLLQHVPWNSGFMYHAIFFWHVIRRHLLGPCSMPRNINPTSIESSSSYHSPCTMSPAGHLDHSTTSPTSSGILDFCQIVVQLYKLVER